MSFRAIALILLLALVPFRASAEGESRTLYLLLLTFGKGDQAVVNQLNLSLAETGRVRPVESPSDADLIGKVEVSRSGGSRTITVTVMKRGGDVLIRTRETMWPNENLSRITGAMAQEIVRALGSSGPALPARSPDRATPVATAERTEGPSATPSRVAEEEKFREEEQPRRRSGDDDREVAPARLTVVFGLELGIGPWLANSADLMRASPKGFDFSRYGPAFTHGLDGVWHPAINAHGGWRFFNAGAIEAAVQSGVWGNDGLGAGGAILVGGRLIGFPLQLINRNRKFELGLEAGFGYAFVGGPYYDMSGKYFSLGVTGEYPVTTWMSLQASYRLMIPSLSRFYVDYANDRSEPVDGFTAYWHTFTVGAVVRIRTRL